MNETPSRAVFLTVADEEMIREMFAYVNDSVVESDETQAIRGYWASRGIEL